MQFFIFVVAFVAVIYGLTFWRKQRAAALRDTRLWAMLRPLTERLAQTPEALQPIDIECIEKNHALRLALWQWLENNQQSHLFPPQLDHREAGAIANLCYQLLPYDELDAQPDLIILCDTITYPMPEEYGGDATYYIFKYNMHPPHWLSEKGWRAAVIGPYFPHTKSHALMSKLENLFVPIEEKPLKAHADAAHRKFLGIQGMQV